MVTAYGPTDIPLQLSLPSHLSCFVFLTLKHRELLRNSSIEVTLSCTPTTNIDTSYRDGPASACFTDTGLCKRLGSLGNVWFVSKHALSQTTHLVATFKPMTPLKDGAKPQGDPSELQNAATTFKRMLQCSVEGEG